MDRVDICCETLTPLWTGGVDGTCDRLHETGLIGSLRWWYEAIVRGLGGEACDPTQRASRPVRRACELDIEKYRACRGGGGEIQDCLRQAGLCDACQLFGATGWRRRFRLSVVKDETEPIGTDTVNIRPPGRNRGWFLPPGRMGRFVLRVEGENWAVGRVVALLLFLERWGNLGAKPQLGYGVFRICNRDEVLGKAQPWTTMGNAEVHTDLPDLRRFSFFRYTFRPSSSEWWTNVNGLGQQNVKSQIQCLATRYRTVPVTPVLRNEWRFNLWKGSPDDAKWMFGTLDWGGGRKSERVRSKVAVSWAYPAEEKEWEVRGWVWLQKQDIAVDVWSILIDQQGWNNVLPKGNLEHEPANQTWSDWDVSSLIDFLEETRR